MSDWQIITTFAFSLNLFVYFIAGVGDIMSDGTSEPAFRLWLRRGLLLLVAGWAAFSVNRIIGLIPGGQPFFILLFVLLFLGVRGLLVLIAGGRESSAIDIGIIDDVIRHPMVFIPVLIAGYRHMRPWELMLMLFASWAGYGIAMGLFTLIRKRITLENSRYRLKGGSILLLSLGLFALVIYAVHQSVFPV